MITDAELSVLKSYVAASEKIGLGASDSRICQSIKSAIATIEALPVTRDGVRIVRGMTLYEQLDDTVGEFPDVVFVNQHQDGATALVYYSNGYWTICEMSHLYAVRANAELAAQDWQE